MDNFLQLVPMEADADSEAALVYGNDDLTGVDAHDALEGPMVHLHHNEDDDASGAAFFYPLLPIGATTGTATVAAATSAASAFTSFQDEQGAIEDADGGSSVELEREDFLRRLKAIEASMRQADATLQQRLDLVKRIANLRDPVEQLSEYLPLMLEQRRDQDIDVMSDLVQCARALSDERDAEVALLCAFVFMCDPPRTRRRGPSSIVPAVAAMMEESSGGGLDHPF